MNTTFSLCKLEEISMVLIKQNTMFKDLPFSRLNQIYLGKMDRKRRQILKI
jgi:hypothetical protein